ncbi:MAG: DUF2064 domain-containing protein [Acidimicrobiia bacterium]|nr:DUF2064 domain-containing protein [Acidimicrobiia bacterium]
MHLTIIAKTPEPGRVKTRLCPPCTAKQAAEIAAAALADTVDAIDATVGVSPWVGLVRRVLLLDGRADEWIPDGYDVVTQRGDGLAERLANGFADLGPGVVVGMDTPVAGRWLGEALRTVAAGCDAIGLASDGGFWVIGLATIDPQVFERIPMGESHTGLAQLRRLHRLCRPVRMLPMTRDLDDVNDLRDHARSDEPGRLATVARSVVDRLG